MYEYLRLLTIVQGNILVDSDAQARLADFGQAAVLHITSSATSGATRQTAGSVRYVAPELFDTARPRFGAKNSAPSRPSTVSDVCAQAVTVWQVHYPQS